MKQSIELQCLGCGDKFGGMLDDADSCAVVEFVHKFSVCECGSREIVFAEKDRPKKRIRVRSKMLDVDTLTAKDYDEILSQLLPEEKEIVEARSSGLSFTAIGVRFGMLSGRATDKYRKAINKMYRIKAGVL